MENLLNDQSAATSIPEKFLDKNTQQVRVDALLKSYLELEKKLAQTRTPDDSNLLTIPASPKDYVIEINHTMFTQDDEINKRLHENGFSNAQAQAVYDLAAEYMVPLILEIAQEFEAERQTDRLIATFGGKERYAEIARQLLAYGKKHLPRDVLEGLATSYEGVMALYRMMQSGKPLAVQSPADVTPLDETNLRSMMRDPRYWRDKDAAFIKKVSDGFRQVFAEQQ